MLPDKVSSYGKSSCDLILISTILNYAAEIVYQKVTSQLSIH